MSDVAEKKNMTLQSKAVKSGQPVKRRDDHRFNKKPREVSPLYKQLVADGLLSTKLGAKLCFYTNKLNFEEIEALAGKVKRPADKIRGTNWLNVSCYSENGVAPSASMSEAIAAYKAFPEEDNRLNIYGSVTAKVAFDKVNLVLTEDGNVKYPYGIFFFSDSRLSIDRYAASVSCVSNRVPRGKSARDSFISPILDYTNAECTGIFRSSGHFVVFYVDKEIEKNKNELFPEVTLIDIEVGITRSGQWGVIDRTFIGAASKASTCTPDDLKFIVDNVFTHYAVQEPSFVSDFIYLTGADPRDYNYIPTHTQAGGEYYGTHAHVGPSKTSSSRAKPVAPGSKNLFHYIETVERTSTTDIVSGNGSKNGKKKNHHGKKISVDSDTQTVVEDASVPVETPISEEVPGNAPVDTAAALDVSPSEGSAEVNTAEDTDMALDVLERKNESAKEE